MFGGPAADDRRVGRLLLFAIAIVLAFAILVVVRPRDRADRARCGPSPRPSTGSRRATCRPRSGSPATTSSRGWPTATTAWPPTCERRNRELGRILAAIDEVSPRDDVEALVERTATDATSAFELIDAVVVIGDPTRVDDEEVVPGRLAAAARGHARGRHRHRRPASAGCRRRAAGNAPTRTCSSCSRTRWPRRSATPSCSRTVEDQNRQLLELDAAKDDFLRGVSHNLQTPLTSIRAYAEQLDAARPDRRLGIIAEQSDRLSRMVRQLLTVTRLESGALKPRSEVVSLATRVRKAWEALGTDGVAFELDDARRRLAGRRRCGPARPGPVGPARQRRQVRCRLPGPGRHHRRRRRPAGSRLTIADGGPGVAEADRDRLFARFARGSEPAVDGGSGLGLYVSRELCRAMAGDLVLEPAAAGPWRNLHDHAPRRAGRRGLIAAIGRCRSATGLVVQALTATWRRADRAPMMQADRPAFAG